MNKVVNGKTVPLTPEETTAIEREWTNADAANRLDQTASAALAYREARREAYVAGLGEEPDIIHTIGDALDALIKAHYGDATELDAMKAKIDRIKAQYPKP